MLAAFLYISGKERRFTDLTVFLASEKFVGIFCNFSHSVLHTFALEEQSIIYTLVPALKGGGFPFCIDL